MICEEEGCCLEQWCLYVHQLKSGFSRVDFGFLFIHDSWPPTAWAWILPPDSAVSSCFRALPEASICLTNPCFEINHLKLMIWNLRLLMITTVPEYRTVGYSGTAVQSGLSIGQTGLYSPV